VETSSAAFPADVTLVIGYGNPLRGDDAVGWHVASAVAAWKLSHVRARAVQQLTPELAELLASVRRAIFVDARSDACGEGCCVCSLDSGYAAIPIGHHGDPLCLLELAQAAFGRRPPAWWITIPASNFAFGAGLSSPTARALTTALREITRLVIDGPPQY
jgi:hydrogenase maturation protease